MIWIFVQKSSKHWYCIAKKKQKTKKNSGQKVVNNFFEWCSKRTGIFIQCDKIEGNDKSYILCHNLKIALVSFFTTVAILLSLYWLIRKCGFFGSDFLYYCVCVTEFFAKVDHPASSTRILNGQEFYLEGITLRCRATLASPEMTFYIGNAFKKSSLL